MFVTVEELEGRSQQEAVQLITGNYFVEHRHFAACLPECNEMFARSQHVKGTNLRHHLHLSDNISCQALEIKK